MTLPEPPPVSGGPAKPRRAVPLLIVVLGGLGLAIASCVAGVAAGGSSSKTTVSSSPSPYPVISTVEHTVIVTVTPPAPPPPPGPATTLTADGTYLVGTDLAPGTYRANSIVGNCYWARLKSPDPQDILSNDNVSGGGQAVVTVRASDKAFETQGCGTWAKIG